MNSFGQQTIQHPLNTRPRARNFDTRSQSYKHAFDYLPIDTPTHWLDGHCCSSPLFFFFFFVLAIRYLSRLDCSSFKEYGGKSKPELPYGEPSHWGHAWTCTRSYGVVVPGGPGQLEVSPCLLRSSSLSDPVLTKTLNAFRVDPKCLPLITKPINTQQLLLLLLSISLGGWGRATLWSFPLRACPLNHLIYNY